MYLRSLTLCIFTTFVFYGGSYKNSTENLAPQDKKSKEVLVEEGWHYRKTNGVREKFFPICAWHVPGYNPENNKYDPTDRTDADIFKTQARNLNMVFTHHPVQRDFLSENDKILIASMPYQFTWLYMSKLPSASKGKERGYYRNQYLKKAVNDEKFIKELDNAIKKHVNNDFPNAERAYAPFDEVAQHFHIDDYYIPYVYGDKVCERLKKFDPNAIIFVDLAGNGKGSSFFFEKRYLEKHATMPVDPPYDAVSDSAKAYAMWAKDKENGQPLKVFYEGYDGRQRYEFKSDSYTATPYTTEELRSFHYENIKAYAEAYKGNGNAFGINAFRDFYADPILAGISVDAIRAGLGDPTIPIWLYFDGNGYAKSSDMSTQVYVQHIKCQMYTSIIHGATGVFFWNDRSKTPEIWNALQPILNEMQEHIEIFKLKTLEKKSNDHMHFIIKKNAKGQKYIIASNTSRTDAVKLIFPNIKKESLDPLEVYISPI